MKSFFKVLLVFLIFSALPARAEEPSFSIENVTGDLYRFQSNAHYGVFLVTDEGIILADPINTATATWLKGELDRRFGVPVKYVIYSNDRPDHSTGGGVFSETAQFISIKEGAEKIALRGEAVTPGFTIRAPFTLLLGKKRVKLRPASTSGQIGVFFVKEKALFISDLVAVKQLPYGDLPGMDIIGELGGQFYLGKYDFIILIPGHGKIGKREDFFEYQDYLINLFHLGIRAKAEGLTLIETNENFPLEKYKYWENFDIWKEKNIEGVLRIIEEKGLLELFQKQKIVFPLRKGNPKFPSGAIQKNICGWAMVEYDVDDKGKTRNVTLVDSEPTGVFGPASITVAKKYRYAPRFPGSGIRTVIYYDIFGRCTAPDRDPSIED